MRFNEIKSTFQWFSSSFFFRVKIIFSFSCPFTASTTNSAANTKCSACNLIRFGILLSYNSPAPKPDRHVTHQNTGKLLCSRVLLSKCLSLQRITKAPDCFPVWAISQSVAHYCNRVLQGVRLGNVSGNDEWMIHSGWYLINMQRKLWNTDSITTL